MCEGETGQEIYHLRFCVIIKSVIGISAAVVIFSLRHDAPDE